MAKLGSCGCSPIVGVNDAVCVTVDLADTDDIEIWTDDTSYIINGTILVENNAVAAGPTAGLTINGTPVATFTVAPGEARAITMNNLNSINLTGAGGTESGSVKVSFTLNYKF